jgi:hypothetical protein
MSELTRSVMAVPPPRYNQTPSTSQNSTRAQRVPTAGLTSPSACACLIKTKGDFSDGRALRTPPSTRLHDSCPQQCTMRMGSTGIGVSLGWPERASSSRSFATCCVSHEKSWDCASRMPSPLSVVSMCRAMTGIVCSSKTGSPMRVSTAATLLARLRMWSAHMLWLLHSSN